MYFLQHQSTVVPINAASILRKKTQLARALKKLPVSLLILHGSVAENKFKPLSDIDFAVMFRSDKYKFEDISNVRELLCETYKREDIDLAILNRASPLLWMNVLKNGKLVFAANKKAYSNFRANTIQRYLQTKHLRTQFHRYQAQAILGAQ